ncbi:MAG: hypothetical protein N2V78_09425 [Methanophagales archaeon]|nr:hypothetical protein [Methanophagales archaeon]
MTNEKEVEIMERIKVEMLKKKSAKQMMEDILPKMYEGNELQYAMYALGLFVSSLWPDLSVVARILRIEKSINDGCTPKEAFESLFNDTNEEIDSYMAKAKKVWKAVTGEFDE